MSIPARLDTFVTDDLIIEPEVGIHKKTYDTVIVVKVIDRKSNTIIEVHVFENEDEYIKFVDQKLSDQ